MPHFHCYACMKKFSSPVNPRACPKCFTLLSNRTPIPNPGQGPYSNPMERLDINVVPPPLRRRNSSPAVMTRAEPIQPPPRVIQLQPMAVKPVLRLEPEVHPVIRKITRFLSTQKVIRVFIEDSLNLGHQTNTLNLVRTLYDKFGYQGDIEIICANEAVIRKLSTFSWIGADQRLKLFSYEEKPQDVIDLCITGGFDNEDDEGLAQPPVNTNVRCFLAIQPYRFESIKKGSTSCLWFTRWALDPVEVGDEELYPAGDVEDVDLLKVDKLFGEKAYFPPYIPSNFQTCLKDLDPVIEGWNQWQDFKGAPQSDRLAYRKKRQTAHQLITLSEFLHGDRYHVAAVYGIKKNYTLTEDHSLTILSRYAEALSLCELKKPVVLLVFHDDIDGVALRSRLGSKSYLNIAFERLTSFSNMNAAEDYYRSKFEQGTQVLILQVGGAPQQLFNYCYMATDLPCVFEGEGTIPLAFARGKAFLYMKGPKALNEDVTTHYPTLGGRYARLATDLQKVANGLFSDDQPENHRIGVLMRLIKWSLDSQSGLSRYFLEVAQYYLDIRQNRFVSALEQAIDRLPNYQ